MGQREDMSVEVEELWRAVFGRAPEKSATPEALLDALFDKAPVPPYTTLRRHGTIVPPQRG